MTCGYIIICKDLSKNERVEIKQQASQLSVKQTGVTSLKPLNRVLSYSGDAKGLGLNGTRFR